MIGRFTVASPMVDVVRTKSPLTSIQTISGAAEIGENIKATCVTIQPKL